MKRSWKQISVGKIKNKNILYDVCDTVVTVTFIFECYERRESRSSNVKTYFHVVFVVVTRHII